jgi:hypothetical protein
MSLSCFGSEMVIFYKILTNENALIQTAGSKQKLRPHTNPKLGGDLALIDGAHDGVQTKIYRKNS